MKSTCKYFFTAALLFTLAFAGCANHIPELLPIGNKLVKTGELLWRSLGFGPRACANPIAANGRIFCNPQVINTLFCYEPAPAPEGGKTP